MDVVYAYIDRGPMGVRTKWKPRRVCCTTDQAHSDGSGLDHVVKFRQGLPGTAALISEIVCGELLARGGVNVPARRLVHADAGFCNKLAVPYQVSPGVHFGTVLVHPMHGGPPTQIDQLSTPQQLVDMWAFDTWFCNIDRDVFGNIGLCTNGRNGDKFELMAIDQSDCFGGATLFSSGTWPKALEDSGAAPSAKILASAIYAAGPLTALDEAISKVRTASRFIDVALAEVPAAWWKDAGVNPRDVERFLTERLHRMSALLNVQQWAQNADAFQGALILNIGGGSHVG